ncbi:TetR/AcrR family transcriptional regulator [Gordonia polyisoprenivorans]|uniref:TetR/AcrR family transcriptional regulator n=1 Tax=Gordonia polyisoprenivorans TaxID=84595 RepID=UPI001AD66F81|nr:TetR/AcrR family transcriptional regulator [Gordonia polyisoprenivorans]QTI67273.1 TetR/AcrR family transcriptional regulator [Gordonia polyisoprenivorans]
MTVELSDTRTRLLDAAADLIAGSPGEEISLRAVCDAVGVRMPTLYHFFGSKQGLVDAVIERGFDLYLAQKGSQELSGDPIQDIRNGWDTHVAFGLANPGFYTLMYGKVRPGHHHPAQLRAYTILLGLTTRADNQGRLAVSAEDAAAHIIVTNIGVTLRQIILAQADRSLSDSVRDGAIAAITGVSSDSGRTASRAMHEVLEYVAANSHVLGGAETQLMIRWLQRLDQACTDM